jgi:hypothetical protein
MQFEIPIKAICISGLFAHPRSVRRSTSFALDLSLLETKASISSTTKKTNVLFGFSFLLFSILAIVAICGFLTFDPKHTPS